MDGRHSTQEAPGSVLIEDTLWPLVASLGGVPWPPGSQAEARAFIEEAMQQFLLPLLFAHPEAIPSFARESLAGFRALERVHRARTDILRDEMRSFAERMNGEPFAVLKGWDYAHRLYRDPYLRPMSDLDILIPAARLSSVRTRLLNSGMRQAFHGGHRNLEEHHEHVFLTERAMIEVHQAFTQQSRHTIDYEGVWRRRVPFGYGTPLFVSRLGDADAIAYQTLSMGIDEFSVRLIRYLDLCLMIERSPDALGEAAELARLWRSRRAFYGALRTTAMVFPGIATDDYLRTMSEILPPSTRARIDLYVIPDPRRERGGHVSGRLRQLWRKFWLIDDAGRRSRFLAHYVRARIAGRGQKATRTPAKNDERS